MECSRFKFRVWDNAENKYNGFSFHLAMSGELDRLSVDGDLLETDPNRFTIEQCTGLTDKNGNLIYEGDVVRCITGVVAKVVYFYAGFKVVFDDPMSYPCDIWGNQEIIGNIHEDQFREVTKLVEDSVCE